MTFYQLVFRNILRQPRVFLSYFFSSVFSVVFFFIGAMLYFHPLLQKEALDGSMQLSVFALYFGTSNLLGITLVLIAGLALLFLGSMFRLYLKDRRQSFSLYLIIGMTKNDLRKMLILENSVIGGSSLIVGLTVGAILSKLSFLIVQNLLSLDFSLVFYPPIKAILLTLLIYTVIFLVISVYTLLFIRNKETNMNLNLADPLFVEPQGNQYLTALGAMLLFFSYVSLVSVMKFTKLSYDDYDISISDNYLFITISSLIIFTCLAVGVYLFFSQTLVHFSLSLRKWPIMLKGGRVLALSNLSYRLKQNSLVYFLIVVSATVAFVAMTTTMALSEILVYGTDQKANLAYIYEALNVKDEDDWYVHQKNIGFIKKTIDDAGYQSKMTVLDVKMDVSLQSNQYISKFYDDTMSLRDTVANGGSWKHLLLIPISQYNEMAIFNGDKKRQLTNNRELLLLSGPSWQDNKHYTGKLRYSEGSKTQKLAINFRFVEGEFNLGGGTPNIGVISDDLFKQVQQASLVPDEDQVIDNQVMTGVDSSLYIIDFKEWATSKNIDKKIESHLEKIMTPMLEKVRAGEDQTFFNYDSAYQTMQQTRQESGLTLFVSTVIGLVFFIFSASTLYFRIYGEQEQDKRYHKTLHVVGVPERNRNQIITIEMGILFFVPFLVATLNYLIIMWSLNTMFSFSSMEVAVKLLLIFSGFHGLFFLVVRHSYIEEINLSLK